MDRRRSDSSSVVSGLARGQKAGGDCQRRTFLRSPRPAIPARLTALKLFSLPTAGRGPGALRAKPKLDQQCISRRPNQGHDALRIDAPRIDQVVYDASRILWHFAWSSTQSRLNDHIGRHGRIALQFDCIVVQARLHVVVGNAWKLVKLLTFDRNRKLDGASGGTVEIVSTH